MKKILFTFLFLFAFFAGYSQMYNQGGTVTVETGATLVIQGNYTSTGSGVIRIDGAVQLKGDFINNSGTIHSSSVGTLTLNGTTAQNIGGTSPTNFYCALEVNNTNGVFLNGANEVLSNALTLTNGKLTLNAYDLTLAAVGVTGASSSKYIVTNGAGQLKAPVVNANYAFPVGTSGSYNPLVLNEAGTADTYGVIFTGAMPGGWSGGTTHSVLGHWDVTEVTPGGNNLTATAQWNGSQEQLPFDRNDCAVGVSINNGGTVAWKASGAAAGSDPYTRSGTGFASVGTFLVGDYIFEGLEVDLDLFLAGPYSAGVMTNILRTKNLIPLTDPYGLGTVVTSIPANVVDWIKVELRDKTNNANVLYTKAFFLDNTGNVIAPDGSSALAKFTGVLKDQYYIAVKHRNHLGAMTNATVDLTAASPAFNFKTGTGIFQNQTYTPMFLVGGGNYGLYKGNVNGDTRVSKVGAAGVNDYSALLTYLGGATIITNVYTGADVNMDGDVRKVGAAGVNDYSQLLLSLGTNTFVFQQIP